MWAPPHNLTQDSDTWLSFSRIAPFSILVLKILRRKYYFQGSLKVVVVFNFRMLSFEISIYYDDPIDNFDEGVEFSVRVCSSPYEWIPIKFISKRSHNRRNINIGQAEGTTLNIRGYDVETIYPGRREFVPIHVNICVPVLKESIQFRWLQTSFLWSNKVRDVWTLDNIKVNLVSSTSITELLDEEFDTTLK